MDRHFTGIMCNTIYRTNYLINGNYLFLRYGPLLEVYDITKDIKFINDEYKFIGPCNGDNEILSINEFICNYEANYFIVK